MDLSTFFDAMEELANQIFPGQLGKCDALIDLIKDNFTDIQPEKSSNNSNKMEEKGYMGTTINRRIAERQTAA